MGTEQFMSVKVMAVNQRQFHRDKGNILSKGLFRKKNMFAVTCISELFFIGSLC